jgi:hypothetical protein
MAQRGLRAEDPQPVKRVSAMISARVKPRVKLGKADWSPSSSKAVTSTLGELAAEREGAAASAGTKAGAYPPRGTSMRSRLVRPSVRL